MYKYVDGQRVSLTQDELTAFNARVNPELPNTIRAERNALLSSTDWWVLPDRTPTSAQLEYREALRQLPEQDGFPENVTWPVMPS